MCFMVNVSVIAKTAKKMRKRLMLHGSVGIKAIILASHFDPRTFISPLRLTP